MATALAGDYGLLLNSFESPEGSIDLKWKVWVDPTAENLRFEIRRILPAVGYQLSERYRVHDVVRDNIKRWANAWAVLDVSVSEVFGRPRSSKSWTCTRSSRDEQNFDEQEFWAITQAVVLMLLDLAQHKKAPAQKRLVKKVPGLVLNKVLTSDEVRAIEPLVWSSDVLQQCTVRAHLGSCHCVRVADGALDAFRGASVDLHTQLEGALHVLYNRMECKAVAAQLKHILCTIGVTALDSFPRWRSGAIEF